LFEAAKLLLSQYPSVFSLGDNRNSGELYSVEIIPEYGVKWFDRTGTQIDQPVLNHGTIASGFVIYDLEGEHIPTIMIFHTPLFHGGGWATLYRYVDGEYREVTTQNTTQNALLELPIGTRFFTDDMGRILMRFADYTIGEFGYYEISFNGNIAHIDSIVRLEWPYFYNSLSGERIGNLDDFSNHIANEHNQTIFGFPDTAIVPISRLFELEIEVLSALRKHHGLG